MHEWISIRPAGGTVRGCLYFETAQGREVSLYMCINSAWSWILFSAWTSFVCSLIQYLLCSGAGAATWLRGLKRPVSFPSPKKTNPTLVPILTPLPWPLGVIGCYDTPPCLQRKYEDLSSTDWGMRVNKWIQGSSRGLHCCEGSFRETSFPAVSYSSAFSSPRKQMSEHWDVWGSFFTLIRKHVFKQHQTLMRLEGGSLINKPT